MLILEGNVQDVKSRSLTVKCVEGGFEIFYFTLRGFPKAVLYI